MPRSAAQRVLAGGAAVEVVVVEDVQLGRHRPAGEVAAPGRGRGQARRGQERVRGGEPAGVGVEITVIPPGASSKRSSRRSRRSSSASSVRCAHSASSRLVPSGEAQRLGLDPGHRLSLRRGPGLKPRRRLAVAEQLDDLLEGRAG